jgi:predicted Zn finger-like uncharacterized protein
MVSQPMMESLLTRCPNCGTTFQLTAEQLSAANGNVRCGSCMHVFDASSQMLGNPSSDDSLSQFSLPKQQKDNKDDGGFSDSFLELDKNEKSKNRFIDGDSDSANTDADREEDWTKALLEDNETYRPAKKDIPDFLSLTSPSLQDQLKDTDLSQTYDKPRKTGMSFDEPEEKQTRPPVETKIPDQTEAASKKPTPIDSFNDDIDALFNESTQTPNSGIKAESPIITRDSMIRQIESDPLELSLPSQRWKKLKTSAWVLLLIILCLLPFVQYGWFNYNELAQDERFRPLFARACQQFKCTLPALENLKLIKTSNLVVRSHPHTANALVIDTVMTNRASYAQNFPLLELLFTNRVGEVVAGRQFTPEEYLKGELQGIRKMAPRQPIHIALDIVDPGEQAVGYALQLRAIDKTASSTPKSEQKQVKN